MAMFNSPVYEFNVLKSRGSGSTRDAGGPVSKPYCIGCFLSYLTYADVCQLSVYLFLWPAWTEGQYLAPVSFTTSIDKKGSYLLVAYSR